MFDISSATNAVNKAKTVFQAAGPAAGLTGVLAGAAAAFPGTLGGIADAVGGFFKSLSKSLATFEQPLPMPNVLHNYATYNYILSLGVLSTRELNFPDTTYMAGISPKLILKSANAEPNNRVQTPYGKFDFFMTELTFEGFVGNSRKTGNTNATNIQFKIVEPYSMGMFMQSCQQAAFEVGYSNFRDAPFIIIIEFRGNQQNGVPEKIPGTTRYLPIKFTNIGMNVTGAGSTYNVTAFAYNEQAHSKQVSALKTDVTVKGKTVQEMLQTGENSLQAVLNRRQKELEEDGIIPVADQYLILFPDDIASSASSPSAEDSAPEDDGAATEVPAGASGDSDIFKKLGVSLSAINSSIGAVQQDGECNAIGKASMGFSIERRGTTPMAEMDEVYNEKKGIMERSKQKIDPEESDFKFPQNSDISNSINNVILNSEFATKALDSGTPVTPDGMRNWWRIDPQVFPIDSAANESTTGVKPKLYVYRVVPYEVHSGRYTPPNVAPPGFEQLKKQAVKEYNYIYTGKNVDVIRFNIDIANGFQQMMSADDGRRNSDVRKTEEESTGTTEGADIKQPKGSAPPTGGKELPTQTSYSLTKTSNDGKGGGGLETPGVRVAKLFQDAILNGKDLVNLDLEIVGDPYFLYSSGMGNYTAKSSNYKNMSSEGSVDYQSSEVDCVVNFRTPIDINQSTGLYDFGNTVAVQQFSGLYKLTTVKSSFKSGQFTQTLNGFRRYGQDSKTPVDASKLVTSTPNTPRTDEYESNVASDGIPGLQVFDDGSSIQTMDDGSTLVTDSDGNVTSTDAP
jgi:hypothetical protein